MIKVFLFGFCVVLVLFRKANAATPNIVYLISDDQTYRDFGFMGNPAGDIAYRWVRQRNLKLIVPHPHHGKSAWGNYLDGPALFDLIKDPEEQSNLINEPNLAEDRARLIALLDDWWLP